MDDQEQKRIFNRWLSENKGIVFKIVRAFAFTAPDQEDLFQEISLQLWQSIPEFRGEAKASTWIYRVALFSATVWARQERRRPPTRPLGEVEHTLTRQFQPSDDRLDWLYDQIAGLEPIDRSVCLLMLDGFPYKEIAAMLGMSESNVGVKIHRIKKHLVRKSREIESHGV
jgi:RNA polymerase sigma-70 factor (ECF subfamily)